MEDRDESRWRTFRACARCHRLKSKCVYDSSRGCNRCLKQNLVCSPDEDPTAKEAKKRPVEISAERVATKLDKWLLTAELETLILSGGVDPNVAELLQKHAERLHALAQKLHTLAKTPLCMLRPQGLNPLTPASVLSVPELAMSPITTPIGDRIELGVDLKSNIIYQVIERLGLLTDAEARARFKFFIQNMLGFFPVVSLSKNFRNYDHLSNECPMVLLVCIYVTTFDYHGFCPPSENTKLNNSLRKIVDGLVAHDVYLTTTNFSYRLIIVCLIQAIWSVPSIEVGDFRTHMEILIALNIALCIDSGNSHTYNLDSIGKDESMERNDLRALLGLYACMGSLSFSLPRFNLIPWSKRHEFALKNLMQEAEDSPSKADRTLCLYAQLIQVGQDLTHKFSVNGIGLRFLTSKETTDNQVPKDFFTDLRFSEYENASSIIKEHQEKLVDIFQQLGNIDTVTFAATENAPKETYCFLFSYFQILILAHDNLVSWSFCKLSAQDAFVVTNVDVSEYLYKHVKTFGDSCRGLLRCYIDVHKFGLSLPPPYHYRALQALISLIRVQVLVKSDLMEKLLERYPPLEFDLFSLHSQVVAAIKLDRVNLKLTLCERFTVVLARINNWINAVANRAKPMDVKQDDTSDFFLLTQTSKGQELYKLHEPNVEIDRKRPVAESATDETSCNAKKRKSPCPVSENPEFRDNFMSSIKDIFKDVDYDYYRFFNPFDPVETNT